ncbi:MAG: class I SAM-dependent methyltransferase, partial [Dehalococcoidia bacterium]
GPAAGHGHGRFVASVPQPRGPAEHGWEASARAWVELIDQGDPSRERLLDPVMLRLCGDVAVRRVVDIGCGEGRFSRKLAEMGATVASGDLTSLMVRTAHERRLPGQDVARLSADALPFIDGCFDLAVSYLVLIDVEDFRSAIAEMARVLKPGGHAVVANLSFMSVNTGWVRDEAGKRLHYPVDRYLEERPIELSWAGLSITNWHRPLGAYMAAFLGSGFRLRDFLEPMPEDDSLREDPYFEDWYRVPNFIVMRWEKAG